MPQACEFAHCFDQLVAANFHSLTTPKSQDKRTLFRTNSGQGFSATVFKCGSMLHADQQTGNMLIGEACNREMMIIGP